MNKKRLLKLADLLEADANNPNGIKFDLALWGKLETEPKKIPKTIPVNCGTIGCAVGLACISGKFKSEGLTYVTGNIGGDLGMNNFAPVFGNETGQGAVEAFFGLQYLDFNFLFVSEQYSARKRRGKTGELAVAKRIRDFVDGKAMPSPRREPTY
jgi:hypothetical protein